MTTLIVLAVHFVKHFIQPTRTLMKKYHNFYLQNVLYIPLYILSKVSFLTHILVLIRLFKLGKQLGRSIMNFYMSQCINANLRLIWRSLTFLWKTSISWTYGSLKTTSCIYILIKNNNEIRLPQCLSTNTNHQDGSYPTRNNRLNLKL